MRCRPLLRGNVRSVHVCYFWMSNYSSSSNFLRSTFTYRTGGLRIGARIGLIRSLFHHVQRVLEVRRSSCDIFQILQTKA